MDGGGAAAAGGHKRNRSGSSFKFGGNKSATIVLPAIRKLSRKINKIGNQVKDGSTYLTAQPSAAMTSTISSVCLSDMKQGDDMGQRDGNKVGWLSLEGNLQIHPGTTYSDNRVLIVKYKGDSAGAVTRSTDILSNAIGTTPLCPYSPELKSNFVVLFDRIFCMDASGLDAKSRVHHIKLKLSGSGTYGAGGVGLGNYRDGHLFLVTINDQASNGAAYIFNYNLNYSQ